MILQKLLFPDVNICNEREMFFREKGNCLSLETYFNSFSIGKWKKYTDIKDLNLHICTNVPVEIEAYNAVGKSANPETDNTFFSARNGNSLELAGISVARNKIQISVEYIDNCSYNVHFDVLPSDGIIYIEIKGANGTKPEIISGNYYTNTAPSNENVNIALGICTFKREEFLNRNLLIVKNNILDNNDSVLKDKVSIYVADNGNTINKANAKIDNCLLSDSNIHFYPNINAGGASGFTRTMIEAVYRSGIEYSHIILMDDDIVLSSDVLERTYVFLSYIKSEYSSAMMGASMFCLNARNIQFEAGARCFGLNIGFYHKMWDMNQVDAVSANEEINPFNYSGWWYNVIPTKVIRENGLPLPLFIHYDDIEYGMRNSYKGNETILLNGICVWHPQGLGKANVSMKYYDVRNVLIAMVGTDVEVSAKQVKSNLFKRVISGILRYRYNDAYAAIRAVEDYYSGPQKFDEINPEANHKEVMKLNYKSISITEAGLMENQISTEEVLPEGIKKYLSLLSCALCQLLPSMDTTKVAEITGLGMPNMARRVFHYDRESDTGILLERDRKEARRVLKEYVRVSKLLKNNHTLVSKQWEEYKKQAVALEYWEQYLSIK